jgi:hypothetical protein
LSISRVSHRSADSIQQSEQDLLATFASTRGNYSESAAKQVRDRICDFVDAARAAGLPPERVIVEVKRLAAAAGWNQPLFLRTGTGRDDRDPEQVVRDIVTVCIERYFN